MHGMLRIPLFLQRHLCKVQSSRALVCVINHRDFHKQNGFLNPTCQNTHKVVLGHRHTSPICRWNFDATRHFSSSTRTEIWFFDRFFSKQFPPALPPEGTSPSVPIPDSTLGQVAADAGASADLTDVVTGAIVDPPFTELGLASSWYPNHFVHQLLEWVHLNTDLPWWQTILLGTLCIRIITLPVYIYTRKYMIVQNNHSDEMQQLTNKVSKAKSEENYLVEITATDQLKKFYKRTGLGPIKGIATSSVMPLLFISSITAVRQMCAIPVPSLTEGGMLWFTNLATGDPYYILPLITGATVGLIVNVGLKTGTLQSGSKYKGILSKLQYVPIIAMPLVFGRTACGIYIFWLTNNAVTFAVTRSLLEPKVKEFLKFPEPNKPKDGAKTGFIDTYKKMMKDSRERTVVKMQRKQIKSARKQALKDRKKELQGKPPMTYTIGVEAIKRKPEVPDFEKEWRPPRPRHLGSY